MLLQTLLACGLVVACALSACAPRQPPGGDLWRAVDCVQKGTC